MTLIPVEEDERTIARGFRKAAKFALLKEKERVVKENARRKERSAAFFEYFETFKPENLYVKDIGLKTWVKLNDLGVSVFRIENADTVDEIRPGDLTLIDASNAKQYCTMGHY